MSERNRERSLFLKARRRRLTPEDVGLPASVRRRVPSLRREDVAWLADVGITWYTWLEQGRPIKIALETLDRVAAALRLDSSETEYLHKLTQSAERPRARPPWDEPVAQRMQTLVESYSVGYAFVMGPRWDILARNDAFARVFGSGTLTTANGSAVRSNALWLAFMDPAMRSLFPNWDATARRMVAVFRSEYADYVGEPAFQGLIDELVDASPEFVTMWDQIEVLSRSRWRIDEIREPRSGRLITLETASLSIPDSPGQTLVFYIPTRR
jgi:MmyB-like transcription regulator ligand binding domain/Helix-turn-helix domain